MAVVGVSPPTGESRETSPRHPLGASEALAPSHPARRRTCIPTNGQLLSPKRVAIWLLTRIPRIDLAIDQLRLSAFVATTGNRIARLFLGIGVIPFLRPHAGFSSPVRYLDDDQGLLPLRRWSCCSPPNALSVVQGQPLLKAGTQESVAQLAGVPFPRRACPNQESPGSPGDSPRIPA